MTPLHTVWVLKTSDGPRFPESSSHSPTSKPLQLRVPPPITLSHAPSHSPSHTGTTHDRLAVLEPGAWAAGTWARGQEPRFRGFRVGWGEGSARPEDDIYLRRVPQRRRLQRLWAERGQGRRGGSGKAVPGRRRRSSDPSLCSDDRPSHRMFSVPSPSPNTPPDLNGPTAVKTAA